MTFDPLTIEVLRDGSKSLLRARTGSIAIQGELSIEECDRLAALFQQEALQLRQERNRVPSPTHYDLLGLTRTATADEVQAAYRTRAKDLHPDTNAAGSTLAMQQLNQAYAVLGDPQQRQQYDMTLNSFTSTKETA
jgi:DnaJ domain